jgi:hypothetical protein
VQALLTIADPDALELGNPPDAWDTHFRWYTPFGKEQFSPRTIGHYRALARKWPKFPALYHAISIMNALHGAKGTEQHGTWNGRKVMLDAWIDRKLARAKERKAIARREKQRAETRAALELEAIQRRLALGF